MSLRIQNNIAAMTAHRNLTVSDTAMGKSLERLSSGFRINSAKDDAAGLAISQTFRANIASVKVAQRNITEANALLQTAEGALNTVSDILTRMKELATQASSANVGGDISKVSAEFDALVDEIDRIAGSTKYAGVALLDGSFTGANEITGSEWGGIDNIYDVNVNNATIGNYTVTSTGDTLTITKDGVSETETLHDDTAETINFSTHGISFKTTDAVIAATAVAALDVDGVLAVSSLGEAKFQVGYENTGNSQLGVSLGSVVAADLGTSTGYTGNGLSSTQIDSTTKAFAALADIDQAIAELAGKRGDIGAYQNRLIYASANLSITSENFSAAESAIRDVDMAAEMTSFTKTQILMQAGTAMLAQANMAPQNVLSLFG
jgi:flagellin